MRAFALAAAIALSGCAAASVPCSKVDNPPFGDRLALAKELPADGPVSQKWVEDYSTVLEACGY